MLRKEIANIGDEDAGKAQGRPISRAKCRQMNLLHGDRLISDGWFRLASGRTRWKIIHETSKWPRQGHGNHYGVFDRLELRRHRMFHAVILERQHRFPAAWGP